VRVDSHGQSLGIEFAERQRQTTGISFGWSSPQRPS
jgi:hypothetical protein